MASSSICRRVYRNLLSATNSNVTHHSSLVSLHRFSTESPSPFDELDDSTAHSEPESDPVTPSDSNVQQHFVGDRPLEDGLDPGIYKAILVGQVGQNPIEKKLRGGRRLTMLSVGTGGIRNNRRPLDNEEPRDYAHRSMVQWHRVSIYPDKLAALVAKHAVTGSILYIEGNLETKIFNDPITGLARRIREIAIRHNGRIVFLGEGSDTQTPRQAALKGVGYY